MRFRLSVLNSLLAGVAFVLLALALGMPMKEIVMDDPISGGGGGGGSTTVNLFSSDTRYPLTTSSLSYDQDGAVGTGSVDSRIAGLSEIALNFGGDWPAGLTAVLNQSTKFTAANKAIFITKTGRIVNSAGNKVGSAIMVRSKDANGLETIRFSAITSNGSRANLKVDPSYNGNINLRIKSTSAFAQNQVSTVAANCPLANSPRLDLMVLYTPEARIGAASPTAPTDATPISAEIIRAVGALNASLCNSGIAMQVNPVYIGETAESQSVGGGSNQQVLLSNLMGSGDYFADNVGTLRSTYGADLVTLVTEQGSGRCLAVPALSGTLNAGKGFSVVARTCLQDRNSSLSEAIGHNLGLDNPNVPLGTTIGANAYGFRPATGYATLMASDNNVVAGAGSAVILPYFSTPNITSGIDVNGTPFNMTLGDSTHNSVDALGASNAVSTVASYLTPIFRNTYVVLNPAMFAPGTFPDGAYDHIGHAVRHSICGITPYPAKAITDITDLTNCSLRLEGIQNGLLKLPVIDDLILVGPGTYNERLGITSSSLTLRSIAGAANTIIDAKSPNADGSIYHNGFAGAGIALYIGGVPSADFRIGPDPYHPTILSTANFDSLNVLPGGQTDKFASPTVDGFTIMNGYGDRAAGGIFVVGQVKVNIVNNIIRDNMSYSGFGAGITIEGSAGKISNNIFFNNKITQTEVCQPEAWPNGVPSPGCSTTDEVSVHNCYWGHDYYDPQWWPSIRQIQINAGQTPMPPRVQLTSPGKYFCHQIDRTLMSHFEPAYNYAYYRQQYTQADDSAQDDRVGGAAIYVSNVCRYNPLNSVDGNLSSIEGVAWCNAESVTGTLEISKNLIYANSYQNGAASASATRGSFGGAVFIDNPLAVTGLPGTAVSTTNHLTVKLISNTITANKIVDTATGFSGAGLGCGATAASTANLGVDVDNSLITGNYRGTSWTTSTLADNLACALYTTAPTPALIPASSVKNYATIGGDTSLSTDLGITDPAAASKVFIADPNAILNAAPSATTGINDPRIIPNNAASTTFALRLSNGSLNTGRCTCQSTCVAVRMHAAVDRSTPLVSDFDFFGVDRHRNDSMVCSTETVPLSCDTTKIRDRGALEKSSNSVSDPTCAGVCPSCSPPAGPLRTGGSRTM